MWVVWGELFRVGDKLGIEHMLPILIYSQAKLHVQICTGSAHFPLFQIVLPKLPLPLPQKDSTLLLQKGIEWDEVGKCSPGNLAAEQNKEEKYLYTEM